MRVPVEVHGHPDHGTTVVEVDALPGMRLPDEILMVREPAEIRADWRPEDSPDTVVVDALDTIRFELVPSTADYREAFGIRGVYRYVPPPTDPDVLERRAIDLIAQGEALLAKARRIRKGEE